MIVRKIELSQKWIDHVADFPESGMGYANVTCVVNGKTVNGTLRNGEHLHLPLFNGEDHNDIQSITFNPTALPQR